MSVLSGSGPVLHPTDFSEAALAAHPYSLYLAGLFGTDLHLLHANAEGGEDRTGAGAFPDTERAWTEVRRWLVGSSAAGGGTRGEGQAPGVGQETKRGEEPAGAILAYAEEIGAGAICMGTHGRGGIRRLVLGSVTEQVVRGAHRPVMTVRQGARGWSQEGPRRVLVGADLSPMMQPALAWAGALAVATGARLTAAHVVTSHAGAAEHDRRQRIHAAFRELGLEEDVILDAEISAGDPESRIRDLAEEQEVDLIVTATHGRSGPARLVLGSTTETLVRRAPCPVLTVSEPPPGIGGGEKGDEG